MSILSHSTFSRTTVAKVKNKKLYIYNFLLHCHFQGRGWTSFSMYTPKLWVTTANTEEFLKVKLTTSTSYTVRPWTWITKEDLACEHLVIHWVLECTVKCLVSTHNTVQVYSWQEHKVLSFKGPVYWAVSGSFPVDPWQLKTMCNKRYAREGHLQNFELNPYRKENWSV